MANELERLNALGLDPNLSDPAPFGPPRPPEVPARLSTLDMLRKRMARELEDEPAQRMSDLGNALLMSRNRSLLGALGEGFRAQDEGTRARMDRLRQLAETERQERSLEGQEAARRAEEAYRQESLRLRREEAARAGRPQFQFLAGANPGEVVAVDPRDPTRIIPVPGARLATDRSSREETALRQNARNQAMLDVGRMEAAITSAGGRVTAEQRAQFLREAEQRALASVGLLPLPGSSTTQQQPAPGGAPSQTLRYDGPRIAPRQP